MPAVMLLPHISAELAKEDIVQLVRRLLAGEKPVAVMFIVVILVVAGMATYQHLTGTKMFTQKARREGRRRRRVVLWEWERDNDQRD